ncbi:hypothetical protein [Zhongshania sp.]|uniref:hypothetical protein n=1 Tax=Zhongshania sp. TaxID=1971902 RepID=UPI00356171B8
MNVKQLKDYIVAPTLKEMNMYSKEAEAIVIGTAAHESAGFQYIHQLGGGPALSLWQMEPATHDDIHVNFLRYKPYLKERLLQVSGVSHSSSEHLLYNMRYACAMCRLHYYRRPEPIPVTIRGQAEYWKKFYNTVHGKGTVDKYIKDWNAYVEGKV